MIRAAVASEPAVESLVVVLPQPADPLATALARAAIAPLAMEGAPSQRLNMVVDRGDARPADIDSAVLFLESARSTTGQILEVG